MFVRGVSWVSLQAQHAARFVPASQYGHTFTAGKRRLEAALKKLPAEVKVSIKWKPFFLNPDAPAPGVDKMEAYRAKFGAARVAKMVPYMKAVGRSAGIKFSYEGKVGNTLNSHRLVELAQKQNKGDEMIEVLFAFYFEQERDISDDNVLIEAASKVGIDAKAFLASDKLRDEILKEEAAVKRMGITGVPAFIVNGKARMSGAQDTDTWLEFFRKQGYLQEE